MVGEADCNLSHPAGRSLRLERARRIAVGLVKGMETSTPYDDGYARRSRTDVRHPHAHLLIHGAPNIGIKNVENRSKPTSYRGTLLIQASAKVAAAEPPL